MCESNAYAITMPVSGVLTKIIAAPGETVPVDRVIAMIDERG
jgi:pyruvate/2-oxoglutarate dehydrogenase complex dihydrolipoamide acyltransferase (E2) component